jgi:hypothetical protein
MKLRHIPALCAALLIAGIGAILARATGADAEDDLDDTLGEE